MIRNELKHIVAVSIETTGLSEFEEEIIEIGAVKLLNGVTSGEFHAYIKPKREIPANVIELTGTTNQTVESAFDVETVLKNFLNFAQGHMIVAHNAEYNLRFLKKAACDLDLQFDPPWMDLLMVGKVLFPDLKRHDFITLCSKLKCPMTSINQMIDEAKLCAQLFRAMMGEIEDRGMMADAFCVIDKSSCVMCNICAYYRVSKDMLVGPGRSMSIAQPRRVAMYLMRKILNESYVNIGKRFNRDHATVLYAVKYIEDALKKNEPQLSMDIQKIISKIESVG